MREKAPRPHITELFSYPVASGDMYYSVVNERAVCVSDDPAQGFQVWGEIPGGGIDTGVDLCQVFIEYAMTCATGYDQTQAFRHMESFGSRLGEALSSHIKNSTSLEMSKNLSASALEIVLKAMNAQFTIEQGGIDLRFVLERCPMCLVADHTGHYYGELAHYGINALCQSLIHALDPNSDVHVLNNEQSGHTFLLVQIAGSTFMAEVIAATPGDSRLRMCLHCGVCGGSCPSGAAMDHTPRALFAMVTAGLKDQALRNNTPWYCVSCYYCMVRCPQEVHIPDLMYTLKRMAIREGLYQESRAANAPDFSETYIDLVENYGRSFEFGLALRYHLRHHLLDMVNIAPIGVEMLSKGRMGLTPKRIKGVQQLKTILAKAKELESTL
jgi:heterodisulfide reductase subunit C